MDAKEDNMVVFSYTRYDWGETKQLLDALELLELGYVVEGLNDGVWMIYVTAYADAEEVREPWDWTASGVLPPDSPFLQAIQKAFQPKGIDNPS